MKDQDTNYPCVLLYHQVDTMPHALLSRWDITISPKVFETHMRVIKDYFAPIGLPELKHARKQGTSVRHRVLITLDDGYKAAAKYAGAILSNLGLASIWFINSSLCTNQSVFWLSKLIWTVDVGLFDEMVRQANLRWPELLPPKTKNEDLLFWAKNHYSRAFDQFLSEFTQSYGFMEKEQAQEAKIFASVDDLKQLVSNGAEIGNHTYSHANLRNLSLDDCRCEIQECHLQIKRDLGIGANCFAFPFGEPGLHWSPWMTKLLHELNYEFVFSVENNKREVSSLLWRGAIPRHFVPSTIVAPTEFRHYLERCVNGSE